MILFPIRLTIREGWMSLRTNTVYVKTLLEIIYHENVIQSIC